MSFASPPQDAMPPQPEAPQLVADLVTRLVLGALRILGLCWVLVGGLVTAGSLWVIVRRPPKAPFQPTEKLFLCLGVAMVLGGLLVVVGGAMTVRRARSRA